MHNLRVFWALLQRDLKILKANLVNSIINGLIVAVIELSIIVVFFPRMGMSVQLSAPLFIGSLVFLLFNLGFPFAFGMVYNLKFSRFIDYQLTLPLPKRWLFAEYITNYVLQVFITTLPVILLGVACLGNLISLEHTNWFYFFGIHLLSIIFFGIFFHMCSFQFSFEWFTENIWPRFLGPFLCLASVFYIWHRVYAVSKTIAYLFLLNPFSYVAEGLRAGLLGGPEYLPAYVCVIAIIISSLISLLFLIHGIKKRLDPV